MIIEKSVRGRKEKAKWGTEQEHQPFVRKNERNLFLNYVIRDVILPHEYVYVDCDYKTRKVTLIPTHEEAGYKVTYCQTPTGIRATICWLVANKICPIKDNVRIPAKIEDNGTITFVVPEA